MAGSGFVPRMDSRIEGIRVIGDLRCRSWSGIVADVWEVDCQADACGTYVGEHPRLFVALERTGPGAFLVGPRPELPPARPRLAGRLMNYVPAGMRLWGQGVGAHRLRHLDVHFDVATLEDRMGEPVDRQALERPRLGFTDDRLLALARLIATEVERPDPLHALYGDGLAAALFIDLMAQQQRGVVRPRSRLTPRQLRRVTDFIEANCLRAIRLQELADLLGLSQSYLGQAFKAATGMAPHHWQMQARIRRAQELLQTGAVSLAEVAAQTGFSDQAHFTRVFKQVTGATPAAWRRDLAL
ncbi:AraC family transcriptional regulator (plasmid) [Tistrella mobilis]|uniref:helix-turn-helix domain-containing protein n=1 Tax=Tistrella mobilis TaxID=171437 RepID=UPI00355896AC